AAQARTEVADGDIARAVSHHQLLNGDVRKAVLINGANARSEADAPVQGGFDQGHTIAHGDRQTAVGFHDEACGPYIEVERVVATAEFEAVLCLAAAVVHVSCVVQIIFCNGQAQIASKETAYQAAAQDLELHTVDTEVPIVQFAAPTRQHIRSSEFSTEPTIVDHQIAPSERGAVA